MGRGDHSARIRMSYQDDRATRSVDHASKNGSVIGKRREGNGRRGNLKPVVSQGQDDVTPTISIGPGAVHQHDRTVPERVFHRATPFSARRATLAASRNSLMAAAISTTCVSVAKCPVSRN